jgi:hypothetical protein
MFALKLILLLILGCAGAAGVDSHEQTSAATIAYFRAGVRELVLTYPLLAGIGITAGEHMSDLKGEFSKERWLWRTYGEGVRDALQMQPGRDFRLIHRYHQSGQTEILNEFLTIPGRWISVSSDPINIIAGFPSEERNFL